MTDLDFSKQVGRHHYEASRTKRRITVFVGRTYAAYQLWGMWITIQQAIAY